METESLEDDQPLANDDEPLDPPPEQFPVLAFDLDDTLWDTAATLSAAHDAMVAAIPDLPAELQSAAGFRTEMLSTMSAHPDRSHDFTFTRKETLRRCLNSETLAEEAFRHWFTTRNSPAFFPRAVETLRELRDAGFRLCAISDGNSDPLQVEELQGIFEFAVSAAEAGAPKPDERPFRLAACKAGVSCSEMIYIGDNYQKDVVGAKNVGMRAIWVRTPPPTDAAFILSTGTAAPESGSIADAEIRHVAELPAVLRENLC